MSDTSAVPMGYAMDRLQTFELVLFVAATLAAALVAGIAGFAFGVIAAGVWLHFLPPAQTAALIAAYGLIVQGIVVWKLRRALNWSRLMPFLIGGALGVPLGGALLLWASPTALRMGVGMLLVLFSIYSLVRPKLVAAHSAGAAADGAVGILNGAIGGATGLAGIAAVVWCSLRGWTPAEQRAVFQPAGVAVFIMTGLWLGGTGMIGGDTLRLFLIGLPALGVGTWLGLKLFGKLDETAFRRIVLALLLASGVGLVVLGR
jgi:uncharacterized membrane protein YfcA